MAAPIGYWQRFPASGGRWSGGEWIFSCENDENKIIFEYDVSCGGGRSKHFVYLFRDDLRTLIGDNYREKYEEMRVIAAAWRDDSIKKDKIIAEKNEIIKNLKHKYSMAKYHGLPVSEQKRLDEEAIIYQEMEYYHTELYL